MFSEEIPYDIEDLNSLSEEEKRTNWGVAFGLQAVDGLKPSAYMRALAEEHIAGRKTYGQVRESVSQYYTESDRDGYEKEADLVSERISRILAEKTFGFSPIELRDIHEKLFSDVLDSGVPVGKFRNYNIQKAERVLNGDSVMYISWNTIDETLAYDFKTEKDVDYSAMTTEQTAFGVMKFISGIWQVHPFGEGNTRTCAVFAIKYLRSLGFAVNNDMFRDHSDYFRDALVMANFGRKKNPDFLAMFTENLLLGGRHDLSVSIQPVG